MAFDDVPGDRSEIAMATLSHCVTMLLDPSPDVTLDAWAQARDTDTDS